MFTHTTIQVQPKKWHEVYANNKERNFFVGSDGKSGLIRSKSDTGKSQTYRSVEGLAKDSGLTKKQVEEIIKKYFPAGIVVPSAKNPDLWGYWENVGLTEKPDPISDTDKEERIVGAGGAGKKSKTAVTKMGNAALNSGVVGSAGSPSNGSSQAGPAIHPTAPAGTP